MLYCELAASKCRDERMGVRYEHRVEVQRLRPYERRRARRHLSVSNVEGTLVIDENIRKGFETSKLASA